VEKIELYLATFLMSLVLIHVFKNHARKIGLVDYPCERKRHCGEVPLVGGVAIFFAFALSISMSDFNFPGIGALMVGSLVLITIGIIDDIKAIRSTPKFAAQIIAGTLMCVWGEVVLRDLGTLSFDGSLFTLGSLAIPFTVFATVGVINAMNMSDGLDGLSGSLTLVALIGLGITTLVSAAVVEFSTIMLMISAVVAFLIYNVRFPGRPRALVFLGDAGSMFIGFVLTWFVVLLSQGENRIMEPVTALWFLALPLFDTVGIMLRRLLKGRSPFRADREHFHHAFQLAGFSVFQTQMTITLLAVVCMGIGLLGQFAGIPEIIMFYGFLAVFGVYFWGMMRAWKVMRFLRRTMQHDREAELEQTNVAVTEETATTINLAAAVNRMDQNTGIQSNTAPETSKVALKLVVNSNLNKDSSTSPHSPK